MLITALQDLELMINLGVDEEERSRPQLVKFSFFLHQQVLPNVTLNDQAEDYICYEEVAKLIVEYCSGKEFRVMEYLCYQIFNLLKSSISEKVKLRLVLEKCHPKTDLVAGSSKCEYSEV